MLRSRLLAALVLLLTGSLAHGAEPPTETARTEKNGGLSLDDLLKMEVTVASAKPALPSEAPAVVSVITREEIELSGARDLVDVLRMVPGFEFGGDIWNTVVIGFRGIVAQNARAKLTIDGMSLNDLLYGNVPFGSHFPVEQIERIEIIRGPGSAMYGNFAELAVINVITKVGAEVPGVQASSTTGLFDRGFARQNLTAKYGANVGENGYFGISLFGELAQRSAGTYTDQSGNQWDMRNDSDLQTGSVGLKYRQGNLDARFLYDNHLITHRDGYGSVLPYDYRVRFTSALGQVSYQAQITDNLRLTPLFEATIQQPWRNTGVPVSDATYYDPTVQKYGLKLRADWDLSNWASTLFGADYEWEYARYGGNEPSRKYLFPNGEQSIDFSRYAFYNEWLLKTSLVNITAGVRLEKHSEYDPSVVPRLSLARSFGDTTVKAIYNRAFRAPTIEQTSAALKTGNKLKTETADVLELEASHRFDSRNHVTVNLFDIRMNHPINYYYDFVNSLDAYKNEGRIGTQGVEAEYQFRDDWGHLALRYSYYRATKTGSDLFRVPGHDDVFLAFPAHKVTLDAGYKVTRNLNLNTTLVFVGDRYGFDRTNPDTGEPEVSRHDPELVANLYLLYRNAFWKGVDVGLGVFDLFGANHEFIQPYNGGHAPLPGPGREYVLRISYTPGI
ncbi:TonB-dependent receptor plug domain-containing protein [Geobacter hydrogenophilus]|uniref:Catecholate siderophore receptor CirA n=1 Tax=Geobacter hydrogenophilus TaxID=40983 RepID=A0A9W6G198_9BACT|nr:TonB-dependent receptor plug domain-containing protein [Geobacter hydrogenophilus]MBT0894179.1 TonB-dependent receptor plug domain-containing protein [Geobacter hydrogenophilus]GLI38538.1 catecholate siderophore receptor CirA [Geobacter hydrogenophilus]